jgi:hypothetical protein
MTILLGFFLVSLPYTSNAIFSVIIKNSDCEKLEINGHPGAGYSFLNLIFIHSKCTITDFMEVTHTLLWNFLQDKG